jgi:hypothetical protein
MREIRTSGLMSGEGKRIAHAAPRSSSTLPHPPPYPIGRSEQTVLLSNRDFGRFLARVFAGAG